MAQAAWRTRMQAASFRGAAFFVRGADGSVGRRTVLHEYPQRDRPFTEDLGRRARQFTVDAYVIGPDYMMARDKLIVALETAGPGTLVHPYLGTMQVAVSDRVRVSESSDEGGMARFSISFAESGQNTEPSSRADTVAAVNTAADDADDAISSDFQANYETSGFSEFVKLDAQQMVGKVFTAIQSAAGSIVPDAGIFSDFSRTLSTAVNTITNLAAFPGDLVNAVLTQTSGLRGIATSPLDAFRSLAGLFDFGSDDSVVAAAATAKANGVLLTPARAQLADNRAAVGTLTRRAALTEAARAVGDMDFASYDQAAQVREQLAGALDGEMMTAADEPYQALAALRVAVIRDTTERGANLARISYITTPATLPALVLAHNFYGDATRAADIVARNDIQRPGFVPGGMQLEVLA